MEELTGIGMKSSTTLPSLTNKYFISLRDENDEPIYTYSNPFMRNFVRQSLKEGRCTVFNQYHKSTISDGVFNVISREIDVNGNICEILYKNFEYTSKHRKVIEDEYGSQFDDYRDNDEEQVTKLINKELNKLPIHKNF